MSFLRDVKGWIGLDPDRPTRAAEVSREKPLFAYVKIPGNIQPIDRGARFEDPLQSTLRSTGVGDVTGGGSQLDDPDEAGRPRVAFSGLDVDLYEVERGLRILMSELRRLNAPVGTVVLYELEGAEYEQSIPVD